ncbi:MAG: hypothetical protein KGH64_02380 [Candidatus Micrarchaeota archaeon]|nr:hypothetical protein [Candidatus Micrarchaeota archaeon]MDE1834162.1 hypothetical protein [Candidatus Micrarchaeota archaeon]MDE1859000.1 hypothetical protein [Candidatus Micrarchaeota archaeon]
MDAVDVIKNTFKALKTHPIYVVPFLAYALVLGMLVLALIVLPLLSLSGAGTSGPTLTHSAAQIVAVLGTLIPGLIILFVAIILFSPVISGMYVYLVSKWNENQVSLSDAFNVSLNRVVDLLLYMILYGIVSIAVFGIAFSPFIASLIGIAANSALTSSSSVPSSNSAAVVGLLFSLGISVILAVIAALIMGPLFYTAIPIVVIEKKGPINALKASIEIGKKDFFGILALMVLSGIVTLIVEFILNIINIIPIIGTIVFIIGYIFILTFTMMIPTMYYITLVQKSPKPAKPSPKK